MYKITVIFCGLIIFSPIITQGQKKSQGIADSYEAESYKPLLRGLTKERRFIFGFDVNFGGLSALGPNSPRYTTGLVSFKILGILPMYNNLTLDLSFQVGIPYHNLSGFIGTTLPLIFQSSLTAGFYIGLGGRVYNGLSYGKGWVIFMGGGYAMNFGLRNYFVSNRPFTQNESLYQMFSVGAELNARFAYYFHPRAAVSLNCYIGAAYAPFAGDPFYSNFIPLEVGFAQLSFGAGLGFLF